MLGDFRRRAERRSRHSARDWRWFAAGFLAATFCLGVAWLTFGTRECPELATTTAPVAPAQPAGARKESTVTAPEPKFTYPQVLEKQEVVVTDADTERRAEPVSPAPPAVKDDGKAKSPPTDGGSWCRSRPCGRPPTLRPSRRVWPSTDCQPRSSRPGSTTTWSIGFVSARTLASRRPRTPRRTCSAPASPASSCARSDAAFAGCGFAPLPWGATPGVAA